jgi:hypothetical protein
VRANVPFCLVGGAEPVAKPFEVVYEGLQLCVIVAALQAVDERVAGGEEPLSMGSEFRGWPTGVGNAPVRRGDLGRSQRERTELDWKAAEVGLPECPSTPSIRR